MNIHNNEPANNHANVDYCEKSFNVSGQEIVNSYRCSQKPFSVADMWNIQKQRKQFTIGSSIS
jgi:hypothetical protein